jgi:hypothetical protein
LLQSPGFIIMAVHMLLCGIGATTTIFSVVDGVLLRPLPFSGSIPTGDAGRSSVICELRQG